jgi:hypothetical protein
MFSGRACPPVTDHPMFTARHVGQTRPLNGPLITVVALTLVVRGGVLLLSPRALEDDPDGYRAVAENLLQHGTFGRGDVPTAYRPPLYPLVLAGCLTLGSWARAAMGVVHVGLGLATVWLTLRLAERWGLGRWAFAAALLVAFDPILLRQSTLLMTETLATFLAVAALFSLTASSRRPSASRALIAGGAIALAALCRPTFLSWLGLTAVILPWSAAKAHGLQPAGSANRGTRVRVVKVFSAFIIGAAVVLAPWVIRNQVEFGRPIVSTTHGGYTLWLANNPDFYEHLRKGPWGSVWNAAAFNAAWRAEAPQGTPADELAADELAYANAWDTIRRRPETFLFSCLVRVGRLWSPLPHQLSPEERPATRLTRYAIAVWYAAELLLAAAGLLLLTRSAVKRGRTGWKPVPDSQTSEVSQTPEVSQTSEVSAPAALTLTLSRREMGPGWLWGILLVACFTGAHAVYWTDMRMRAPLMPAVAVAAAAGAAWLAHRL